MSWIESMRKRQFDQTLEELKTLYECSSTEKERLFILSAVSESLESIKEQEKVIND